MNTTKVYCFVVDRYTGEHGKFTREFRGHPSPEMIFRNLSDQHVIEYKIGYNCTWVYDAPGTHHAPSIVMQFWGESDSEVKCDKCFQEVVAGCDSPPFQFDSVEAIATHVWYPDIKQEEESLKHLARRIYTCCGGTETKITRDTNDKPVLHISKGNIQEYLAYTDHGLTSFNGFLPKHPDREDGCVDIMLVRHIRKWPK